MFLYLFIETRPLAKKCLLVSLLASHLNLVQVKPGIVFRRLRIKLKSLKQEESDMSVHFISLHPPELLGTCEMDYSL